MLKTVVKKGSYHDSVVLMLLTNKISAIEGVKKVSIMMATPANKDIFKQSGLDTEELMAASANDMVVVASGYDYGADRRVFPSAVCQERREKGRRKCEILG